MYLKYIDLPGFIKNLTYIINYRNGFKIEEKLALKFVVTLLSFSFSPVHLILPTFILTLLFFISC